MYCPSCGSEEIQLSQYCRACGTNLRLVRSSLERPDAITASAVSAREQIGVAIADRIRDLKTGKDLEHFAEDVLPKVEKFLESPEEKRLRRIRAGVVTSCIGVGWSLAAFFATLAQSDFFPLVLPGFVLFLLGLGIIINGLLFTAPKKKLPGTVDDASSPEVLDSSATFEASQLRAMTNELTPANNVPGSVTEHTTHHLNPRKL